MILITKTTDRWCDVGAFPIGLPSRQDRKKILLSRISFSSFLDPLSRRIVAMITSPVPAFPYLSPRKIWSPAVLMQYRSCSKPLLSQSSTCSFPRPENCPALLPSISVPSSKRLVGGRSDGVEVETLVHQTEQDESPKDDKEMYNMIWYNMRQNTLDPALRNWHQMLLSRLLIVSCMYVIKARDKVPLFFQSMCRIDDRKIRK